MTTFSDVMSGECALRCQVDPAFGRKFAVITTNEPPCMTRTDHAGQPCRSIVLPKIHRLLGQLGLRNGCG